MFRRLPHPTPPPPPSRLADGTLIDGLTVTTYIGVNQRLTVRTGRTGVNGGRRMGGPGGRVRLVREARASVRVLIEQVYPVEAAAPAGLKATLRPYQAQSLAFMLDVERSTDALLRGDNGVRGGWLADEMGMGKTLQARLLVHEHEHVHMHAPAISLR